MLKSQVAYFYSGTLAQFCSGVDSSKCKSRGSARVAPDLNDHPVGVRKRDRWSSSERLSCASLSVLARGDGTACEIPGFD